MTMRRRDFLALAAAAGTPVPAWAQGASSIAPGAIPRIGWLTAQRAESLAPNLAEVRAGLADLGLVEGRNVAIDYRYGDDDLGRVPEMANDLLRRNVSVIVAQGAAVPILARMALPVPFVYVTSGDPVISGFAESLARPLHNMTGITFMAAEMNGKRLELLRDMLPGLRRIAVIANPEHPGATIELNYAQDKADALGIAVAYHPTRSTAELEAAFADLEGDPMQGVSVFADGFALQNRQRIVQFGMRRKVPVVSGWAAFAQSGALSTYGPRLSASYRRLAYYIQRILAGARPADLPIEQPTTFELVVNLKTARTLGMAIPPSVLARADEVIE
jgi:putative ABC transport system substrate-binding protein